MRRLSPLTPAHSGSRRSVALGLLLFLLLLGVGPTAFAARQFEIWVQGRVLDQAGEPVEGVEITVTRERSRLRIQEETDAQGRYRVFLLDGRYEYLFELEREGYLSQERTLQPIETRSHDNRDRLARRPEGVYVDLDFTLRSVESIEREALEVPEAASPAARRRAATSIHNEGVEAAKRELWPQAEEKFRAAVRVDPELGKAQAALAKVLFEQRRCEESLEVAEVARELMPSDLELLNVRYHCLRRTGDTEKAAEALDELAERAPRLVTSELLAHAVELYEAHDSEAAVPVLERLVETVPDQARAHYYLGLALLDLGQAGAARAPLERFLELEPDAYDADDVRELLRELGPASTR